MPKIQNHTVIDVTPEKFLSACDSTELQELELQLSKPFYQHKMGRGGWAPNLKDLPPPKEIEENTKIKILSNTDYWEEAGKSPEHISERITEAVNLAFKEAARKAKTMKTGNSGSWLDASVDKNSILSLQIKL